MSKISEMTRNSITVLTAPRKENFQRFQTHGDSVDATLYMLIGLAFTALCGFKTGLGGAINNLIISVVYFMVLCHGMYFVAKRLLGHNDSLWNQISYVFSLFLVPLCVTISVGGLVLYYAGLYNMLIVPWLVFGILLSLFYVGQCLTSIMQLRNTAHYLVLLGGAFIMLMGIMFMGFKLLGFM